MRSVLKGFQEFIMRGNVIELAVAVVIGAAFGALINAVVSGLFNPLIAAIFGTRDLTDLWAFELNNATFQPGVVIDALIKFLAIAAAVYFVIVMPMNAFAARRKQGLEPEPAKPSEDVLILQEIRDLLAAQSSPAARNTLTGAHPTTGAHAALAPTDGPRTRSI